MGIHADVDVRPDGLTHGGDLVVHPVEFALAGRPVVGIVLGGVLGFVNVELYCIITRLHGVAGGFGEVGGRRPFVAVNCRVTINADFVTEFSAQKLVHGHPVSFTH